MRLRLFQIVQRSQNNDQVSRWYDLFIVSVAFISIIPLMFKSEQISPELDSFLNLLDIITVYILFADYIFRWITYDIRSGLGKKAFFIYPFTPMAIIDLFSILPSVTILHDGFKFLRILRIVRILRMFNGLTIMTNVFVRERKALLSIIFFMFVYVLAVGLIMFTVEPDTFNTFLDALYWSTTALATIGYGDITPVSDLGKFLAIVSSMVGIAIVAFPAGIVTGGYITQLQKAREKGQEYFTSPVRHDKIFKGKPISKYKSIRAYFKANKKVKYYSIWMLICILISMATTIYSDYFPNFFIYFDEYGSILAAIILEPCAGIIVALVNDVLYSVYSGSNFGILSFGCGAMYAVVFGVYFRRGRKVTFKSVFMVFLVCVLLCTLYLFVVYSLAMPGQIKDFTISMADEYALNSLANFLNISPELSYVVLYFFVRLNYAFVSLISVVLIRQFLWGSKIDPMMKIPVRKRFKQKIYKRGKNEHNYIVTWLEANTDEDEDIPEYEALVKQGKKSIAASRQSIKKKREEIIKMQKEVQDKIAEIQENREYIAKHEEAIDVKRRAVKKVKRKQKIEQSDIIPNFVGPNLPFDNQGNPDPNVPGADTLGSTGSFDPVASPEISGPIKKVDEENVWASNEGSTSKDSSSAKKDESSKKSS